MIFNKKQKEIIETEWGKSIYIDSKAINQDILFLKSNNIKGVIISNDNGFNGNDLSFFKHCDFIESVTISIYSKVDYLGLNYLKNLKALYLNILCKDSQGIDFSNFPKLQACSFTWNNKMKSVFECSSLEYLSISKFKGKNLQQFAKLQSLEVLRVYQSSIETLIGIESLVKLKHLDLYGNRNLNFINELRNLNKLGILEIEKSKGINNIDAIYYLNSLFKLKLIDLDDVESIRPLQNLQNLKEIHLSGSTNIVDGDLSPCINIPIRYFKNRKHYNYKNEEIDRLNENR